MKCAKKGVVTVRKKPSVWQKADRGGDRKEEGIGGSSGHIFSTVPTKASQERACPKKESRGKKVQRKK